MAFGRNTVEASSATMDSARPPYVSLRPPSSAIAFSSSCRRLLLDTRRPVAVALQCGQSNASAATRVGGSRCVAGRPVQTHRTNGWTGGCLAFSFLTWSVGFGLAPTVMPVAAAQTPAPHSRCRFGRGIMVAWGIDTKPLGRWLFRWGCHLLR